MGLPTKSITYRLSPKVSSLELRRIIDAYKNLDGARALAESVILYKNLGWSPLALDARTGTDLQVDFGQPDTIWLNLLMKLALSKNGVSLAIHLKNVPQLFVLKVNPAFGEDFLDSLGDWRSGCIARAGDSWEHHFLVLPPPWCVCSEGLDDDQDAPLSVIGTDALVVVPPSMDPVSREIWHWLQPPWEQPPRHPAPILLLLLEEGGYISRKGITPEEAPIGERSAPPSSPTLWNELQLLAGLTMELEQQLEGLERQRLFSTANLQGDFSPESHKKSASITLAGQKNSSELEESIGEVEEFLLRNQRLFD